jgi:hypothetical protein
MEIDGHTERAKVLRKRAIGEQQNPAFFAVAVREIGKAKLRAAQLAALVDEENHRAASVASV